MELARDRVGGGGGDCRRGARRPESGKEAARLLGAAGARLGWGRAAVGPRGPARSATKWGCTRANQRRTRGGGAQGGHVRLARTLSSGGGEIFF